MLMYRDREGRQRERERERESEREGATPMQDYIWAVLHIYKHRSHEQDFPPKYNMGNCYMDQ